MMTLFNRRAGPMPYEADFWAAELPAEARHATINLIDPCALRTQGVGRINTENHSLTLQHANFFGSIVHLSEPAGFYDRLN